MTAPQVDNSRRTNASTHKRMSVHSGARIDLQVCMSAPRALSLRLLLNGVSSKKVNSLPKNLTRGLAREAQITVQVLLPHPDEPAEAEDRESVGLIVKVGRVRFAPFS